MRLLVERAYNETVVEKVGDGEKEDKLRVEQERREEQSKSFKWWKELVSNVAYEHMTLHWSVEEGLLSNVQVGVCGMVAGGAMLADAWRKTA